MTTPDPATPRVVVGIDGSEHSAEALRWAARIATTLGASIDVCIVWQYPISFGWAVPGPAWNPQHDAERVVYDTVRLVFGEQRPAGLRILVRQGNPAHVLMDVSRDAAMLVVGSRGHGGFTGLLIGSVSRTVTELASCPVLVVHGDVVADDKDAESTRGDAVPAGASS